VFIIISIMDLQLVNLLVLL